MDSILFTFAVLVVLQSGALLFVARLYRRARAGRRSGGETDAALRAQHLLDLEARMRWEALDLSLLHEVNREEMEKLLRAVRTEGVRSLSAAERALLDRMADALERGRERSRGGRPATPPHELPRPS